MTDTDAAELFVNVEEEHLLSSSCDDQDGILEPLFTFKLCGDNLYKSVKRRYMRSDKGNLSLHYMLYWIYYN